MNLNELNKMHNDNAYIKPKKDNNKTTSIQLPIYDANGKQINKKRKLSEKQRKIITIVSIVVILVLGIIYLPSIFMSPSDIQEDLTGKYIAKIDSQGLSLAKNILGQCGDSDFDNDGLKNKVEITNKSQPFKWDTDDDGLCDKAEMELRKSPTKKDTDYITDYINSKSSDGSSLRINNVILWPDNDYYKAHAGVVRNQEGNYVFNNFRGWVQFADGKYAYKIENNKHSLLKHKKDENTWYIDTDKTIVEVTNKEKEQCELFTIFGGEFYTSDNFITSLLSHVLPNYGFISCQKLYKDDTYINSDSDTTVDITDIINNDEFDVSMYTSNQNSLTDIASVYNTIHNKKSVIVYINNDEGLATLLCYGYTKEGNLLVYDNESGKDGILYIKPNSYRAVDGDLNIVQYEYYDFIGCGYNTTKSNSTISFKTNGNIVTD